MNPRVTGSFLWLALCFCALDALGLQSKYAFKSFYEEGDALLESQNYQGALEKYQEAYRLEQKAQRYKEEGAFFRDYLPRYKIALCYEKLDILTAEEWADKSREALEEDVIRRQKKVAADYHRDLDRIARSASSHRQELKARYDARLLDAERLLAANRFEEARAAYEELSKIDAGRPESAVGLQKIAPARENFIKSKILDAKTALINGNLDGASALVDQIAVLDKRNSEIPLLRGQIRSARQALAEKATRPPPETKETTVADTAVNTRKDDPPATRPEPKRPIIEAAKNIRENRNERKEQLRKAALRTALLGTLKPYRRGDPAAALAKLEEIEPEVADGSSSYHWLKSLYLLGSYHHALEPDPGLKDRARQELGITLELLPDFEPDPNLYPRYVLEFVQEAKKNR